MRNAILSLTVLLVILPVAGCAPNKPKDPDVCPANKTLVCETRMGKTEECTCHNKAQMRDVFDLRRNR